ncbi:hypothetical protein LTR15_010933 [Elasticomyces elasticus]|nr:hypothetical protein LTR15_010933 [Elasticomyces elasticus]
MKNPQLGHVFGSDARKCDVLLDQDDRRGISARHFFLQFAPQIERPDVLYLINRSKSATIYLDSHTLLAGDEFSLVPGHEYRLQASREISFLITFFNQHRNEEMWTELRQARSRPRQPLESRDGKVVAVKICGHGTDITGRLTPSELHARELDIMLGLKHPNIIPLLDYAVVKTQPYATLLILELAVHGTLRDKYGGNVQDNDLSKMVTRQVLDGLDYLHGQNIIHRHVTPDNILVMDKDLDTFHCKIADFSHAQRFTLGHPPTDVQGTAGYIALECAKGKYSNNKSDVFSCGKVAFWLLTGSDGLTRGDPRKIRTAASAIDGINANLESWSPTQAPRRSDASSAGRQLLSSMLDNNADVRPTAGQCLKDPWFTETYNDAEDDEGESSDDHPDEEESQSINESTAYPSVTSGMGSLAVNDLESAPVSSPFYHFPLTGTVHDGGLYDHDFPGTGANMITPDQLYGITIASNLTIEPWRVVEPQAPFNEADIYNYNYNYQYHNTFPYNDLGSQHPVATNAYLPRLGQHGLGAPVNNTAFDLSDARIWSPVAAQYATQPDSQQPTLTSPSTTHDDLFVGTIPRAGPSSSSRQQPSPTQRGDASRSVGKRR